MAKLLLEFAKPPDEVHDAGRPIKGTVSLVISKVKGMRCARITVQLQCREISQARSSSSRSGQLGRMGASSLFRGISAALKLTEFCVSEELYHSESMEVLSGTIQHPFQLLPAPGSPGSLPLPGRSCPITTGCERIQYVLVASAVLKGRMRTYKVSCEQELALFQSPPLDAIREYREYYCTEQSTGTSQSNDKTFWFFSGQVKCTASLNRNRFFLSESDPLVLSLEVCNDSTATMRGMSATLAMEIFTDSSAERMEQDPSRLASSAVVPLEFAIPVGDAMANACVLPGESKGFTWPLPLTSIDQLYPSFRGHLVNVQYRLVVKLLFKGVNVPLKMVLPVTMLEPPRHISLARDKTEVPPAESGEAAAVVASVEQVEVECVDDAGQKSDDLVQCSRDAVVVEPEVGSDGAEQQPADPQDQSNQKYESAEKEEVGSDPCSSIVVDEEDAG